MIIVNRQFPSIEQAAGQATAINSAGNEKRVNDGRSFADILSSKKSSSEENVSLKFSKHASSRLLERNIELSDTQMDRLQSSVRAAGEKGINESLVMVDQLAFIVNIKNQTVITALDQNEANTNVFTNIDGAVIA